MPATQDKTETLQPELPPSKVESVAVRRSQPQAPVHTWVAIAYNPQINTTQSEVDRLLNPNRSTYAPSHPLTIFLPPVRDPSAPDGSQPLINNIFLKIGANLDISAENWAIAETLPSTQRLIKSGAIRVFRPEQPQDELAPGYRHFASESAIQLLRLTLHEDWVDQWMENEMRSELIKTANEQKKTLIEAKAKRVT